MSRYGWYGVDLDGTLAEHYWPQKGRYDDLRIGDPIPAMVERVKGWLADGRDVRIFTARVAPYDGRERPNIEAIRGAIEAWTLEHLGVRLLVTATKDHRMVALWDDRAVRVLQNVGEPCCSHDDGA